MGLNEKLEKYTLIAGMVLTVLILIFILMNAIGILPFYFCSSVQCCGLPVFSIGMILCLYYVKKYRIQETDRATQELVDRTIKKSFAGLAITVVIGGVTAFLVLLIIIIFWFMLPQYFIFSLPAILVVAVGALVARLIAYYYRGSLIDSGAFGLLAKAGSQRAEERVEKQSQKARPPGADTPTPKSPIAMPPPPGDGVKGVWYSPDKAIKAIFYPDKKFDIILPARPGQAGTYIGGTFRKDGPGHYWLRPEFEGTIKSTARPVDSQEMEYIMDGNRLWNATDENIQFLKE